MEKELKAAKEEARLEAKRERSQSHVAGEESGGPPSVDKTPSSPTELMRKRRSTVVIVENRGATLARSPRAVEKEMSMGSNPSTVGTGTAKSTTVSQTASFGASTAGSSASSSSGSSSS